MKKLFTLFLMLMPMVASADEETEPKDIVVDGVTYRETAENQVEVLSADQELTTIAIPESVEYEDVVYQVTRVASEAFKEHANLKKVNMPNSVTEIGERAFEGCTELSSVNIPTGLKEIGSYVFKGCTSLPKFTIPEGITAIKEGAFAGCTSMPGITIASTVTAIGEQAFADCTGLTTVKSDIVEPFDVPNAFTNYDATLIVPVGTKDEYLRRDGWHKFQTIKEYSPYGDGTFGYNDVYYRVTGESTVEAIAAIGSATQITIPQFVRSDDNIYEVTAVAEGAFKDNTGLKSVKLSESVVTIGSAAFQNCTALTSVNIPGKVMVLSSYVFAGCTSIGRFAIPKGVVTVGEGAFYGCSAIPEMSISETVFEIESKAFGGCKALKDINCYATEMPETSVDAFSETPIETATLHVDYNWEYVYEAMEPWNGFGTITHFPVIFYMVDDDIYEVESVPVGSTITPIAEPEHPGYNFSGWGDIPETMPNEDVYVHGTFTPAMYQITYMIDGEFYTKVSVEYGSVIIPPQVESREGYDFSWGEYPETMPAYDITIHGSYVTGIHAVSSDEGSSVIYNLQGQQIDTPRKGLYIIDGKKRVKSTPTENRTRN